MTDEIFEQRLRRDLRRLADELAVESSPKRRGHGSSGRPGAGSRHGSSGRPGAGTWSLRRSRVLSPTFGRILLVVWLVVAVCLVGSGVVAGRVLTASPARLHGSPAVATLAEVPGPLAYFSGRRLYTASPGSAPRGVATVAAPGSAPQWSADGSWIAYLGSAGHLHLVRPDGSGAHLALAGPVTAMAWSPAADLLAVVPAGGSMRDTLVLLAAGTQPTAPTVVASSVSSFVWSAGGRRIAYAMAGPGLQPDRLVVYDVVSGTSTVLPYVPPAGTGLLLAGWWPDGSGLVVWLDPGRSAAAEATGLGLVSVPLGSAAAMFLARTFVYLPWLAWSPGGHRLALASMPGAFPWQGSRIEVCRPAAGTCTALPEPAGTVGLDPAWSPSGDRLAFVRAPVLSSSSPGGGLARWYQGRRLWVARADGSGARPVLGAAPGAAQPRFTPSGRSLVYVTAWSVDTVGLTGGHAATLATGLAGALDTAGPDGYGKLPWGGTAVWGS